MTQLGILSCTLPSSHLLRFFASARHVSEAHAVLQKSGADNKVKKHVDLQRITLSIKIQVTFSYCVWRDTQKYPSQWLLGTVCFSKRIIFWYTLHICTQSHLFQGYCCHKSNDISYAIRKANSWGKIAASYLTAFHIPLHDFHSDTFLVITENCIKCRLKEKR